MTTRHVLWGGLALVAYVVAYTLAGTLLPEGSTALTVVSDVGFVALELGVLALCMVAILWTQETRGGWVWRLVALWVALNLAADSIWGYYEIMQGVDAVPYSADLFYLLSYLAAFAAVLVACAKTGGRLRTLETSLDAMMFTIGATALTWPFLIAPFLDSAGPVTEHLVELAYPIGDLLVLFAFVSFLLGYAGPEMGRPRPYYLVLGTAFLIQIVADAAYWMNAATTGDYAPGSWMDPVWLLCFAAVGVAALMAMSDAKRAARGAVGHEDQAPAGSPPFGTGADRSRFSLGAGFSRTVIPYLAVLVVLVMLLLQLSADDWRWDRSSRALTGLGLLLLALLLVRQYLLLLQNRRLTGRLRQMSLQLEDKVESLADLNQRLETLNEQSHRLNALRDIHEVAEGGLELACSFAKCPAGWLTARDEEGMEPVIASRGQVDQYHPGTPRLNALSVAKGVLRAVPLEIRGETLGTIWLVRPAEAEDGADLLPAIATHIATALDNAKRYEEAVHLAERDALTGLYNHRGIHRRLAGEALRAQQSGSELSLAMLDLDDFKALNDTYGHPAGDAVLRQVSDAVRSILRHSDLAGRVGGDELLIVLPNTGAEGALQFCERLHTVIAARPYTAPDGQAVPLRFSLGVATYPEDAQSLGQLIEVVDANLYVSKHQGGGGATPSPRKSGSSPVDADGVLGVAGRLLSVVGARDHYTRRHSEHVGAMLHDVGKIGVAGTDMPSGGDIPLMGRILAIADAYSAMTLDRPYRGSLTPEQARAELRKAAGTQFDPDLVDKFLRILETQANDPAGSEAEAGWV